MKKRIIPVFLVMVLLIAALSVTAMAATNVAPNEVSNYAKTELSAALATVATNGSGKAYCPACNKEVTWYSTNSGADVNLVSYHWFIQGKMDRKGTYTVDAGKTACYYLNGFDLTSTAIGFNVAGTLNIIGNGTETVSGTGDGGYGKGSTINVNGGTVNLYGGKYTKQDTVGNAVVALPVANGTVNMYAGTTITGGTSSRSGGNVCLTGNPTKFNMYGGTVSDGKAYQGGNLYAETGGVITIDGGSVTGGSATNDAGVGGNVALYNTSIYLKSGTISGGTAVNGATIGLQAANLFQTGGSITGGTASNGGAIYGQNGPIVQISAGSVSGGKVTGQGGNIMMKGGTLTVSGTAQITDGEAKYGGGNIYIWGGNTTTITGGTISGGKNTATYGGGNLCVENAKATISGGTIKDGTAANQGGNIYLFPAAVGDYGVTVSGTASIENGSGTYGGNIASNGRLDLLGGAVTGGTASYSGATVAALAETAVVTVSGATVTGGTVTNDSGKGMGGALYAEGKGTIKITSGTIQNGNATNGGNIGINNGYLELSGGTIKNGTANYGGNLLLSQYVGSSVGGATITGGILEGGNASAGGSVYLSSGCKVTMTGLSVTGGESTSSGGSFYVNNAQLTLENCSVSGGKATGWAGGSIYADTKDAVVTVKGTTTISGGQAPSGGNIAIHDKATLDIQGGEISGGVAPNYGGNIFMNNGTLTQTGGTVKNGTSSTDSGGNLYVGSSATATISNATYEGGSAKINGGSIYTATGLTVTNSAISGGEAQNYGGNIYLAGGTLTMTGGSLATGSAANGGNVFLAKSTAAVLENVTVTGGQATASGGAFYVTGAALTLTGGSVTGGKVTSDGTWNIGGNIYIDGASGSLTVTDATVSGGEAYNGGNIAIHDSAVVDIGNSQIADGAADSIGGNVYLYNGYLNIASGSMTGGEAVYAGNLYVGANAKTVSLNNLTIEDGTATKTGGNTYFAGAATLTGCKLNVAEGAECTGTQLYNEAAVTLNNCTVSGGTICGSGGITFNGGSQTGSILADSDLNVNGAALDVITIRKGTVTMDGAARINNLDVYKSGDENAKLVVKDTFTGEAVVYSLAVKPDASIYGEKLDSNYTATGDFTGKLILNWLDGKPWAFHDNGGLVVGNARTVKKVEGKNVITWHKNNEAAVKNYGDADMMYPGNHDLPLAGGDYVVNISDLNMNVTGTGNVYFYDSANTNYKDYGTVIVNGPKVQNEFAYEAPDGNTYYMLKDGSSYSVHCMSVKVNGVSIRPSSAGIYYTSVWQCDDALKDKIESFGVAVSLANQPDAGFRRDADTLYTAFDKNDFVSGKTMTSVLIDKILEQDKDNAARAKKTIYATAYAIFNDGTDAGVVAIDGANQNHSLQTVMELIDENPKVYLTNKGKIDSFYDTWKNVMSTWNLTNIKGTPAAPAQDDTLNVLMIGNSYCYYYVQELYDLLASDGINANVYNLYKSGCTMKEHYEWWENGTAGYQFFWKTNKDGYNLVKGNATMAEALMTENWDVISIQESLFKNIQSKDGDALLAQNELYRDTLIPMLKNAFPNAQIYWHQQWGPETGFSMNTSAYGDLSVPDAAAQAAYTEKEEYQAQYISEKYGIKIVNTGDAWASFRANPDYVALLPAGGLCARIGEDNFAGKDGGDGYHDGDIGGGQYLNACVWYETLTGESCVGKTFEVKTFHNDKDAAYAPYYELSAELVDALQKVAHATVNK